MAIKTTKKSRGNRPVPRDQHAAIKSEIVARIAEGETLRSICRDDKMPNYKTCYDWLNADTDFATRFAHARGLGHDVIADECLEIADNKNVIISSDGVAFSDVQRDKLRIHTRMQLLAKWDPKKWGDRQAIQQLDKNGNPADPAPLISPEFAAKLDKLIDDEF